jgi:type VI secretion system VasD/TssJ family lipoprotein
MPHASAAYLRVAPAFALLFLGLAPIAGCKKKDDGPTCVPEEKKYKVRAVVQPTAKVNPDEAGEALPTVVRFYQLSSDEAVPMLDFRETWEKGKDVFGDSFLAEDERQFYPDKAEVIELEPDEKATHILAVALFRQPAGISWYRVWEVPKYHGESVCLAERQKKTWADPCFYVLLDGSVVDGGHAPPPGWDKTKLAVACPGPPLKVKPPAPEPKKKKKKKKKPDLKKLEKAQDAEAPETPSTEAPSAPEAPTAPEAPGKG